MFTHDLVTATLSGALMGLLLMGVLKLMGRGGAPTQQGEQVLYRPRPFVWVLGILFLLSGLWLCGFAAVLGLRGDWQNVLWVLLFSALPLALAALLLLPRVVLDGSGVYHKRALLKPLLIRWEDLSHYELTGSVLVTVLLLRPHRGDTIKLSNRVFDTDDLMRRAVQRTGIPNKPYQRQSWGRT